MLFLSSWMTLTLAAITFGQVHNPDDYIHSLGATTWGFWGQTDTCPEGSFAYGFEIRVEREHGFMDDDTSVNAIKLFCRTPSGSHVGEITSSSMSRGSWTGSHHCISGYLNGYDLKSHTDAGSFEDNTAANALRMYCTNDPNYIEAHGNKWGHWLGPSHCRKDTAICGIMTRVQEDQGAFSDDTALNDVRFLCCKLPA